MRNDAHTDSGSWIDEEMEGKDNGPRTRED